MARHKVVGTKGQNSKSKKLASKDELPSDDEIDKFHKLKDKLSLNPSDDDSSGDEDDISDEEAVFNLSESGEESEDEDDEDEDDDEDDRGRLAERALLLTNVLITNAWTLPFLLGHPRDC
jgi:hypothetical protein